MPSDLFGMHIESLWEEGFAALTTFQNARGYTVACLSDHIEGTFKLGTWVGNQRQKRDIMSAERRKRLDEIGFVWRGIALHQSFAPAKSDSEFAPT